MGDVIQGRFPCHRKPPYGIAAEMAALARETGEVFRFTETDYVGPISDFWTSKHVPPEAS